MKKIICFLLTAEITAASFLLGGNNAFASLSTDHASTWSQYCASHSSTCAKNENPGARSGSVSCPNSSQSINQILVHAGDGQNVYELPDSKFSSSINGNSVTVNSLPGSHDLSWIMVNCTTSTTPPPPPPTDVCSNIEGNQSNVPEGYHLVDGVCIQNTNETPPPPPPTDLCPNIEGNQSSVPEGYQLTNDGCYPTETEEEDPTPPPPPPTDLCSNLDGTQTTVPEGYTLTDGICLTSTNTNSDNNGSNSSNNSNNSSSNNNSNSSSNQNSPSQTGSVLGVSTFAGTGSADLFQQSLLGFGLTTQTIGAAVILLKRKSKKN